MRPVRRPQKAAPMALSQIVCAKINAVIRTDQNGHRNTELQPPVDLIRQYFSDFATRAFAAHDHTRTAAILLR